MVAGKGKAVGAAIKYGPLLYEASRRYGPRVWDQVKSQREPAERYVQAKVDKGNQHKKAVQHADTVVDGSTLQVFYLNAAHWVVFSGDEPIAVHPRTSASFTLLLKNADLSKRVKPVDEPTPVQRMRSAAQRRPSSGRKPKGPQQHARADINLARPQGAVNPAKGPEGSPD